MQLKEFQLEAVKKLFESMEKNDNKVLDINLLSEYDQRQGHRTVSRFS